MKKLIALVLSLTLLLGTVAFAEDLGVQIIGGPNVNTTPHSLDDMMIGESYIIDGYAVAAPKEFLIVDCFAQFGEEGNYSVNNPRNGSWKEENVNLVFSYVDSSLSKNDWRYADASWMDSGKSAEFVWLMVDVTNLQKVPVDFTKKAAVKVIYQDDYEFNGWVRQVNYDNLEDVYSDGGVARFNQEKGTYPMTVVMNPAAIEEVAMMYGTTYVFGCTIPNYVVEDEESPLRIEITLDGNVLTYNIRK